MPELVKVGIFTAHKKYRHEIIPGEIFRKMFGEFNLVFCIVKNLQVAGEDSRLMSGRYGKRMRIAEQRNVFFDGS